MTIQRAKVKAAGTWASFGCALLMSCARRAEPELLPDAVVPEAVVSEAEEPARPRVYQDDLIGPCPMHAKGTNVEMAPIPGGGRLLFITRHTFESTDLVARVRRFAETYQTATERGAVASGPGRIGGADLGFPTHARVNRVPGGARVDIVTLDPMFVPNLRSHLSERARVMNATGTCPIAAPVPAP